MKRLLGLLCALLFSIPAMSAETLCNLVQFNETRINDNTWAAADKSHGFEVCANVYSAHVGSTPLSNCNAFGIFVPARVNESVSINFFNYNPYFGRAFYCEVTADGKCNTEPVQYYSEHAWVTHTMTLTQSDSIGFIIEWFIDGTQTRNYTAENYTVVKGSIAPSEYIPYDASCGLCPNGQVLQTYTSATGTVTQNGTPTPANPIEPVFYNQGDMTLRAVGYGDNIVADTYDATTGKITSNVDSYTFTGNESFTTSTAYGQALIITAFDSAKGANRNVAPVCNYFLGQPTTNGMQPENTCFFNGSGHFYFRTTLSAADFKTWLAARYAEGNPVIAYFARSTSTTTDWTETSYCQPIIKIATTKYNNAAFSSVVTALNNAVDTIKTVVSNTINQATAVANLQSGKQTKPTDTCPAGKTCLLVEDMNGNPHWYEIVESYVAPNTLPAGYTELAYIQSTGTQYIDTGYTPTTAGYSADVKFMLTGDTKVNQTIIGFNTEINGVRERMSFGLNTTGTVVFGYGNGSTGYSNAGSDKITLNNIINLNVVFTFPVSLTIDGTKVATINDATRANTTAVYLMAVNSSSGIMPSTGRWYSTKIYNENNTLVRDFIPARRESDGVLGMYDLADNNPVTAFHTNAGTGTFTAGPVVLPAGYTALQYIQSSGTQYIDTGLTTSAGTTEIKVVTDFTLLDINTDDSSVILYISTPNSGLQSYIYKGGSVIYNQGAAAGQVRTDVDYIMETVTTADMRSIQLNGGEVFSQSFSRSITDGSPIYTFGAPGASGTNTCMIAKIRNQKFYRNGSLVRNLVPAKQGNTVGMYDTVNGHFYQDAAGGNFTAGPVAQ